MKNTPLRKKQYVEMEGIRYYIECSGEGRPLFCLHGFSEDHTTWNTLNLNGYRLYKIDLIGHGKTDRPEDRNSYRPEVLIRHLHELIHRLVDTEYSLLGYSMGGRLALSYTLQYPREVKAFILESSSLGIPDKKARTARVQSDRRLAEQILCNGMEWFAEYWSDMEIFATQKSLSKDLRAQIRQRRVQNSAWALANTLFEIGQGTFPYLGEKLSGLSVPLLYVAGELDKKYVLEGSRFLEKHENTTLEVIPEAGHNVHLEKSREFQTTVRTFLEKENPL